MRLFLIPHSLLLEHEAAQLGLTAGAEVDELTAVSEHQSPPPVSTAFRAQNLSGKVQIHVRFPKIETKTGPFRHGHIGSEIDAAGADIDQLSGIST